jgi:hypothetical protein
MDLPYGAAQSGVVTAHGVEIMARLPGPPADPAPAGAAGSRRSGDHCRRGHYRRLGQRESTNPGSLK